MPEDRIEPLMEEYPYFYALAIEAQQAHDPAQQVDNGYERCALCSYTRHPCDVYELATIVLTLLGRLGGKEEAVEEGIEAADEGDVENEGEDQAEGSMTDV